MKTRTRTTALALFAAAVCASVLLPAQAAERIPMKLVHGVAAALFAAMGLATLFGLGARFGL